MLRRSDSLFSKKSISMVPASILPSTAFLKDQKAFGDSAASLKALAASAGSIPHTWVLACNTLPLW